MKISVIVPVYNTDKYLERCIESILSQTYKDLQIILIDDGSTDNSGGICDRYAQGDNRIVVCHTENFGVSCARNTGITLAAGDYIAFVDSDDTVKPDMYETLLSTAIKYSADIVTSDFIFNGKQVKNTLKKNVLYNEDSIKKEVLPQFTYNNSIGVFEFKNKLFKSELIKTNNIRFYEGFSYQEDLMFMINIYAYAKSLYYLPQAFYEYVPLPTGLYSSYRENGGERFIIARAKILSLIEKYSIENIDITNFNITFLYNITYFIYRTENYIKNRKRKKELINGVLDNSEVKNCCEQLGFSAQSFDKRIARAVYKGHKRLAVFLICFVHSGKAGKTQKILAKIKKGRRI